MEHSNNISTIDNLAEFIVSTNDNMRNNGFTGKSKGDLMKAVYGENYSNVDSALPLGLLEEMNINNDERWRYVMDYQNGSGGRLTDLINSLAEKNPYVIIFDEYEEVDNLPILSAMEEYKNSNYMFEFNYDYIDISVEDYINEQVNQFRTEKNEMKQQYRGYVRDIEYQGFLAIDENDNWLSDYEFEGEEFDRDNLLKVAKKYPQAEYITFHARLMGDSDFGIEDELSPIDDLAMVFDRDKLKSKNMYGNGGGVFNHKDNTLNFKNGINYIEAEPITKEDKKKYIDYLNEFFNNNSELFVRYIVSKDNILTKKMLNSLNEVQLKVAYSDAKKDEISRNDYLNTFGKPRPTSSRKMTTGGNVNDYFAILTEQLDSKYGEYSRFEINRIKNGIEIITDEEDVFNEIKEDYANDILFIYPTFYQIEIKDSDENLTKIKRSYPYASWRYIYNDDRIGVKTEDLQTFEEIRQDFNDGEILYVFPPMYRIKIGNFEEFTFEEIDSLLRETLEKYNYNYDAGKDNEDYLYEQSKKFEKEDSDILHYAIIKDKWRLPIEKRESVELKLLNRRNRKGNNDYKGDINNNGITYYNVGIDEGEDIGTRTLEFFDTKTEAQAFMDKFLLSNPNAKLFIDVEKRQPILDKKVIGQQGNVIVNPQEVSSIVEDKIKDFIEYAEQNDFDGYLWLNLSLRDYIDEVFNDSPTEVESIEEIDFEDEIENFIIYFTSDEEKREELRNLMLDYLDDDNDTNEEISRDNLRYQVPTNNLYRRLQFINEDINRVFKYAPKELLDFKVEGWEDIGTLLSNIEIASDLTDNASDDWKGSKINMAKGGSIELANEKYLNSIPLDKKTRILQNIADHYGISEEQAYAEITDIQSEALYEYITDQNLKMHVYQMMK